jgi:hypothetical protein
MAVLRFRMDLPATRCDLNGTKNEYRLDIVG